jgi:hypothetical protein
MMTAVCFEAEAGIVVADLATGLKFQFGLNRDFLQMSFPSLRRPDEKASDVNEMG